MKTLHLTNAWHASSGGIATFYRALMDAAARRHHEIRLVVPGASDGVEEIGSHARIYSIAARPAPLNPDYRLIFPDAYIRGGSRLRQILNQERPDVVEVCDKYTLNYFAAMLRSGMMGDVAAHPVTIGLSCERMDDNVRAYLGWNSVARFLVQFYIKWLYFSFFDHHIANSEYTADELRRASTGHAIRRGVWIRPMGVDTHDLSPRHRSSFARHCLLERVHAGADAALLLYVGRLAPEKNLALLLDTLENLETHGGRDWRLILLGDGVQRRQFLADAARRVPARVAWLGHIRDRKELATIYANCDVFLHPNPREPFGIAPLEAMASGLPVVAPDRGGVTSYADSTNAWIVPPNALSFANAVREVIANPAAREVKVARALKSAFEFRWQRVADSFLDLYADLWHAAQGQQAQIAADFYSTAPQGNVSPVARFTAGILQRLLATR
jgi:alpha-1,6-mannosyltransferase